MKNRLVNVTTSNDSMAYVYDTDGIRIGSTLNEVATHYLVDKNRPYAQVLEERSSENDLLASYTYGNDLLRQKRGSENRYFHYDRLGSTKGLTDDNQTVTDVYHYDAFGNPLQINGATLNHYRFTGEQHDQQTGLIYLRARYYNPSRGRFLTSDTWQGQRDQPITLHKYLYANGNPVVFVDPTGQMSLASVSIGLQIRSILNLGRINIYRRFIKALLKSNKYHVFKGTSNIPRISKNPLAHHFVYVEKKFKRQGWRFDIGIQFDGMDRGQRVQAMKDIKCALDGSSPTNTYPGFLIKDSTSRKEMKKENPTTRIWRKEARFTILQYFLWQFVVYEPYKETTYSFQGRWNCQSWTAFALIMAKRVGKIPLFP